MKPQEGCTFLSQREPKEACALGLAPGRAPALTGHPSSTPQVSRFGGSAAERESHAQAGLCHLHGVLRAIPKGSG